LALDTFQRQIGRSLSIVQDFHPWQESFPTDFDRQVADSPATLLLSWAGTDTRQIASGRHDTLIRQRAQAIKELGSPILFRWRWEMDRPNLASVVHSPADYIAAWKHVRSIFQEVGATNAGWVWCPLSTGFDEGRAGAYYPGDDQVEWICTDAYSPDPSVPFASVAASFLSWAADHDKPIIFAEIGAQHTGGTARAEWLRGVAETTERYPQIKAVVYFEANVDRDGYQRSWSLRTSATDLAALRSIADRPVLAGKLSAGNG
jgi:beta-mannanase